MHQKLPAGPEPVKPGEPQDEIRSQVALISPFSLRCGVAEYSRHLAEALASGGTRCLAVDPAGPVRAQLSREKVKRSGTVASIQYHPGLYGPSRLVEIAHDCAAEEIEISVTFHHTGLLDIQRLGELDSLGASFVVHTDKSLRRLKRQGMQRSFRLKMGVPSVPDEPQQQARARLGILHGPVIGTCGFLRPHKGLAKLIQAVALLQEAYPGVSLLALVPLYPLQESAAYLIKCVGLVNRLELQQRVRIQVDFMDSTQLIRSLHACDLVVLPDADSTEAASAAARTAIAARRPVLTSRSRIFDDLSEVVLRLNDTGPPAVAGAIGDVLANRGLYEKLASASCRYADKHSWERSAVRMLQIFRDSRNSRLEGAWHLQKT